MSTANRIPFQVRGWHVAAGVSAFFAVVISVDATFMTLALRTHPGQVSVTPYEDGLLYNRKLAELDAQAKLGWRAAAEARPGAVRVEIQDRQGAPLRKLTVSGDLQRPATEAGRRKLRFTELSPGVYEASADVTGAWDLTASIQDSEGRTFTAERRLTWR
jgi:nitrogen fixation protein FixH